MSPSRPLRRALRAFAYLLAIVALLVLVLVVNTLRKPRSAGARSAPPQAFAFPVADDVVAGHLAAALRVATVSHEDAHDDAPALMASLFALLESNYPHVHSDLTHESFGCGARLYTWKGSDPSLAPALFAAHLDVVPVEPGTETKWTHPAFDGAIDSGYVWGRGALDDKASAIAIFEAAESLLASGFHPRRTQLLAFGCDEEVGGEHGAKLIAEALASRNVHLDFALDEGSAVLGPGIAAGTDARVAMINVAEKGLLSIELTAEATGGHSSMPPPQTTIGIVAAAVDRLERTPMPARLVPSARESVETLAPYMEFGPRVVASNLWLLEPVLLRAMAATPTGNALTRTTTAPTVFNAGVKSNVLPPSARAIVNFRILPGDKVADVIAHVETAIADPRVHVAPLGVPQEATLESPRDSRAYALIAKVAGQAFPDAVLSPGITVGATDVRRYASIANGTYRFVPMVLQKDDLARIHGTNERISVDGLGRAVGFYARLMKDGGE